MTLEKLVRALAADARYGPRAAVPGDVLAALRLPDGRVLPESLAVWLAFDNRYPSLLSVLRGDQPIVELR
ncbi:MAG: hypothetical protein IT379_17175, partial [Deltaproteobacteria bacterium]|nr:hypothetical protein [Deltaproteobacteria bacterium]